MKHFFIYLLFFLLAQSVYATSIVVLVTPDYILMATDSRRTFLDAQSNVSSRESVCKIRKAGDYCFALTGLVASEATRYSADSIVSKYLKNTTDYDSAISYITADIKKALQKEFTYQKKHQPQAFKKTKASKNHLLEMVVLSVQNNKPKVQIIGFALSDEKQIQITDYTASCPGDCPAVQNQFYFLGEYKGIEKYMGTEQKTHNPEALLEQLITVQSQTTPQSVGTPVNMVKLTADGLEWIK